MSPNSNEITVSIEVVDSTPPVVTVTIPSPNGLAGWFVSAPVTVNVSATDVSGVSSFACTDNGSAIAVGGLSGIGTPAAQGSLSVSGAGTHNIACVATDGVGNTGAAAGSVNTGTVKIDIVAPTVAITTPASSGIYILNATVNANYACADPTPGSGMSSCVGTRRDRRCDQHKHGWTRRRSP